MMRKFYWVGFSLLIIFGFVIFLTDSETSLSNNEVILKQEASVSAVRHNEKYGDPTEALSMWGYNQNNYCLNSYTEVIGFSTDLQNIAKKNTKRMSVFFDDRLEFLTSTKTFIDYETSNISDYFVSPDIIKAETFSRKESEDILAIARSSLENMDILFKNYSGNLEFTQFLVGNYNLFDIGIFETQLQTMGKDSLQSILMRAIIANVPVEYIELIYEASMDPSIFLYSTKSKQKSVIQFALENSAFNLIPFFISQNAPTYMHTPENSFYYSLGIGAKSAKDINDIWNIVDLLVPIIGEPTAPDVLKIIQNSEGNLGLEKLNYFGYDALSFGVRQHERVFETNQFDEKWLKQNTTYVLENWRHYIVDVDKNSQCKSVSKENYHWTDEKLISWYRQNLRNGNTLNEIDRELSNISRLYVERARSFILRGDISLVDSASSRNNKDLISILELVEQEEWLAAESSIKKLRSEEALVGLTNSMIMRASSIDVLNQILKIGAKLDATSLITALHLKDSNTLHWLLQNGVDFNSKDMFGRELIYWIVVLNRFDIAAEFQSELESVEIYSDTFGLNPNELLKLQCVASQDNAKYLERFKIASNLSKSVNSAKCNSI
jgi:hypothetical protein